MKTIILVILGMSSFIIKPSNLTRDLEALNVIENKTEYNGVYYYYEIKNSGDIVIPAGSYTVYFSVNGKKISFDKATSEIQPGQVIRYKSTRTFYWSEKLTTLNYSLEIIYNDSNIENNILTGKSQLE